MSDFTTRWIWNGRLSTVEYLLKSNREFRAFGVTIGWWFFGVVRSEQK